MATDLSGTDDAFQAKFYRQAAYELRSENYELKRALKVCRDKALYLQEHHSTPEAGLMLEAIGKALNVKQGRSEVTDNGN